MPSAHQATTSISTIVGLPDVKNSASVIISAMAMNEVCDGCYGTARVHPLPFLPLILLPPLFPSLLLFASTLPYKAS
jgi:hypothetical protein